MNEERKAVLAYLHRTRQHWVRQKARLSMNELAVTQCEAKIAVLEGITADIDNGYHVREYEGLR